MRGRTRAGSADSREGCGVTNERMTSAEYRASLAATSKQRHGSDRTPAGPNPYRGLLCPVCGLVVRADAPAEFLTVIDGDGRVSSVTARHLACEKAP